jgi:transposase
VHAPDLDRIADEIEAAARVLNKAMTRAAEANFVVKLNVYRQDLQDDVLKEWRAVATRYEKTAASFLGVLQLAAALDWLRR